MLWKGDLVQKSDVSVSPDDRGYVFGDGIYEVFRVYNGRFFEKAAHLDRLERTAHGTKLKLPWTMPELSELLDRLLEKEGTQESILYMQITRGEAPRIHQFPKDVEPVLLAYCKDYPRPVAVMENGITAVTLEDIRWLRCDLKTLNLLPNTMAKQEALDRGADDVIWHRGGTVTECSASNVMMVKDGVIRTHPANHLILHGVTRAFVLKLARQLELPALEKPFTLDELANADELFLTGTTVEVTPIVAVDGRPVGSGKPGTVTRQLQRAFAEAIALV
ncbi:D-alanine aminotransferase [Gordoniibacillus kamchatkensis]|uniref:D-alanine aminotransferase n=2 Tax=Gordoniibacillus kamchatkensis TaxID=1590651 RepID=A0ABR5ABP0_9BACL|nr:D-amino-acid transaminase [Paenibacillus sp. VKM B-2647]KIL38475.1 D-alanine aminotransferase [Paenibacillus sp. VKM B-2647]